MPEIAEVHISADRLNELFSGFYLNKIEMDLKSKFIKYPIKNLDKFMFPIKLNCVYGKGKKIIFEFEDNKYIVSSMGMEGHWVLKGEKHSNIWFEFQNRTIYFDDSRHFGFIDICLNKEDLNNVMSKVGYCLLSERDKITSEWWLKQFRNNRIKKIVCDFLIDQTRFSGIGNWLRAEILYKSKINPYKKILELSEEEIELLRMITFKIIDEAYKLGGLTIVSYWDPFGKKGQYECECYNMKVDSLGNKVIKEKVAGGRMIHWVPEVQK